MQEKFNVLKNQPLNLQLLTFSPQYINPAGLMYWALVGAFASDDYKRGADEDADVELD